MKTKEYFNFAVFESNDKILARVGLTQSQINKLDQAKKASLAFDFCYTLTVQIGENLFDINNGKVSLKQ